MSYVTTTEAQDFGAAPDVTQSQLDQAGRMVDAYLKRPEGLIYEVDGTGNPVCMAGLSPSGSFMVGALSPGLNVAATLAGPVQLLQVGDVLIADRGTTTSEALVIVSLSGSNVTFRRVRYDHDGTQPLLSGLVLSEQKTTPNDRAIIRLSRTPVAVPLSGVGRYGYRHRGDIPQTDPNTLFALSVTFGGPPRWEVFDPINAAIDPRTGQVWVPAGLLMAYYAEVRLHYLAGWATAPDAIKSAVCRISNNISQYGYGVPMQAEHVDGISYTRANGGKLANGGMIDAATEELLQPYRVRPLA